MAKKNSVNLNDLSTWTLPVILLAAAVIIGILFYIIKAALVEDVTKKIRTKAGQISKEEKTYAKNTKVLASLPQLREEIKTLETVRDEAKTYLPTEVSMPSLINYVDIAAEKNGINFNSFVPEKGKNSKFYTIMPISLTANVGYISMASFIEEVTTLKRIMNIQNVSFSRGGSRNRNPNEPLSMTAKLTTYIFKDDSK